MSVRWTRVWFSATALCVLAGVVISMVTAANNSGGHFHPAAARAANSLVFFTIDSNLLCGVVALLLAIRIQRGERWFAVLRMTSLIAIIVTGVVYNTALRGIADLATTWAHVGNELVHLVVPVLVVVGWLLSGPRGLTNARVVWLSLIFPVLWLAFTLVRGAIAHWYPYPFIDVTKLGYGDALVNCVWVALLFLGLSAGATVIDRHLPSGPSGGS
jgi:hypothetical protein